MKHPLYYLGDILTKVGCGFFGGACDSIGVDAPSCAWVGRWLGGGVVVRWIV